ncbi:hypothetical protein KSD_94150 [Ktedonobacter sp. SOSP1-85]|uniref:hypothetical protein n=1 Tax=Ktedonobacter sp. SOSP1-85 TaxID=2778367 RepID=UPI0019153C5C|nr:hypothetical protein [Ktedonobacter sp. SOSP1-85]GHO81644.1 hypothetical protein KSD_94150 [Ktedonobacter sp. SOSP1-85]
MQSGFGAAEPSCSPLIVVKVELVVSHNERTEGCTFGSPRGDQGGGLDFSYVLPLAHEVVAQHNSTLAWATPMAIVPDTCRAFRP